jgi:hypothetical protein
LVADRLQRDAILIELNPEYAEIARWASAHPSIAIPRDFYPTPAMKRSFRCCRTFPLNSRSSSHALAMGR